MPVGMQFIAKAFDEENLLQIAYAFEQNIKLTKINTCKYKLYLPIFLYLFTKKAIITNKINFTFVK